MFENIEEHEQLTHFCEAYREATGQRLRKVRKSERPDFICQREDGSLVGVEFTLITRDPESSQWDSILNGVEYMDGDDAVFHIQAAVATKASKRSEPDWKLPNSSILVLSTPDCPISDMEHFLDAYCRGEFDDFGFTEIWLADHSEMEAYGAIELFCLFPTERWGRYARDRGKPYG